MKAIVTLGCTPRIPVPTHRAPNHVFLLTLLEAKVIKNPCLLSQLWRSSASKGPKKLIMAAIIVEPRREWDDES